MDGALIAGEARFLSPLKFASEAGCSRHLTAKWAADGTIPAEFIRPTASGKRRLISSAALPWIASHAPPVSRAAKKLAGAAEAEAPGQRPLWEAAVAGETPLAMLPAPEKPAGFERLTPKIVQISKKGESARLFAVWFNSAKTGFWLTDEMLPVLAESPRGICSDLSARHPETGVLKSKRATHDGSRCVFMIDGAVLGWTTMDEVRFVRNLLDDTRTPKQATGPEAETLADVLRALASAEPSHWST